MIQALTILAASLNMLTLGRLTPAGGLDAVFSLPAALHAGAGLAFTLIAMWRALQ